MAAVTLLGTQTFDTNSGTHTVVATPAVGDLIVIVCANTGNTATTAPTDDNSSGTYTLINTATKASAADTLKMWVRDALIAAASSTTFTHAPGASTGGGLGVFKITGMSKVGSAAVRQTAQQTAATAGTTPTPALGVVALTTNPLIGSVFVQNANPAALTPRSAYTEHFDTGWLTPTTGIEAMSVDSGETASSIAWGGSCATVYADIIVELDAGLPKKLAASGVG